MTDAADASQPLPLTGVRILACENYGAGPWGSMNLADLGAEVIKIEPPGAGDFARDYRPHGLGEKDSQFFQAFNRNKRSITLNLRDGRGRELLRKLAGSADAICNNMRGDQPAKLGIDYASMKDANPAIVCAHLSGYGRGHEREKWPAFDYLMQAELGWATLTGEVGSAPARSGLPLVDYMTGITMALGLVSCLFQARVTGRGRDVDVSLYDVAAAQLSYPAVWWLNAGHKVERRPRNGHPTIVPCEMFEAADGPLFIMCVTEKFWLEFCRLIGREDLPADIRFATPEARFENRDALMAELDPVIAAKTVEEWSALFEGHVPVSGVHDYTEGLATPFAAARGIVQGVPHPQMPDMKLPASPIRLDSAQAPLPAKTAPAMGADTDDVLRDAGLSDGDIAALRGDGII